MRRAVAYWKANVYSGSGNLLDRTGNGHNAVPTGTKFLDHTGTQYAYLPGLVGNYLSAPDSAALSITGDIDLRAAVAADEWSADQIFIAKWTTSGDQRSYRFSASGSSLVLAWSSLGSAATVITKTSTATYTVDNGALLLVRATLDVDNGAAGNDVKFYTKTSTEANAVTDLAANTGWTQLGDTVTTALATSIFDSTAVLNIGAADAGGETTSSGKFYSAVVKSGIDGTTQFESRLTTPAEPFASFTESSTNAATVTINRAASGVKTAIVDRDMFLFGTDDVLTVTHHSRLDNLRTVVVVCRVYGTPASGSAQMAKKAGAGNEAGFRLVWSGTRVPFFAVADGAAAASDTSAAVTAGVLSTMGGRRYGTALVATTDGASDGGTAHTLGPNISTTSNLTIGNIAGAGFADMEFVAAGVWTEILSDTDLRAARRFLLT